MGKRILIIGAGGFIGGSLLDELYKDKNYEITALDIAFRDNQREIYNSVNFVTINITRVKELDELFSKNKFDFVIHLSGILSKKSEVEDAKIIYDVNVNGTTNIALLSAKYNSKMIFFSTAMVYGDNEGPFTENFGKEPNGYYALSKSIGESLILEENKIHNLDYTIFRPSVIYGPTQKGGMFIPSVCDSAIKGEKFGMTEGKQKRDFIFIDDVVSALKLAIEDKELQGIYNLSSGESTLLRDVPSFVQEEIPLFKVEFGKVPYRDGEIWDYSLDNSKLKSFSWTPKTSLKNGIKAVLKYKKGKIL